MKNSSCHHDGEHDYEDLEDFECELKINISTIDYHFKEIEFLKERNIKLRKEIKAYKRRIKNFKGG